MQAFYYTPASFIKFMEMGDEITVYASDNPLTGEWRLLGVIGNIDGQAEMQPTADATQRLSGVIARYEAQAREDKQALNVCKASVQVWRNRANEFELALENAREEIVELKAQLEALGVKDQVDVMELAQLVIRMVGFWRGDVDYRRYVARNDDGNAVIGLSDSSESYLVDKSKTATENATALMQAWMGQ